MNKPEYLEMFTNKGDFRLKVKFKDNTKHIVDKQIQISEITKLISPETQEFYNQMYFDEHLLSIKEIVINIKRKEIVIKTK